ncbi:hypothetical protein EV424DRAFT_1316324 [Suillus variegatus]|nr:hypothetical protein EV424DRAFT_1316324 [Suillus variegatus]
MFRDPISLQTPIGKKPPKPSSLSQDSIAKAKGRIQKLTPKRSLNDMLFDIQKANLDAVNARSRDEMKLKKRQCLLEEFKAGIWDAAEYRKQLDRIEDDSSSSKRPAKQARYQSPDWDLSAFSTDELDGGSF